MKRTIIVGVLALLAPLFAHAQSTNSGGYALDFNGHGSYVSVGLTSPPSNNYTISAWVYLRSGGTFSGERMAVLSSTTCGDSVELMLRANSDNPTDPQYVELGRCGFYNGYLSSVAVPFNLWTHVAVTVTSNNVVSYYVNGNPAGSYAADPHWDFSLGSGVNLGDNSGVRRFDGQLDEVQIWNRALSAPEIQRGIHFPLAGNEAGLFAYYRFDEGGSSGVVADSSLAAGGLRGTLVNNPLWVDSGALLFPVPLAGFAVAWGGGLTASSPAQSGVMAVAANYLTCFGLKTNGTVVAWGYDVTANFDGQSNFVAIAAAGSSAAALKADGSLVLVGTITNVPPAVQSNIVAVSMGGQYGSYVLALAADGSVFSWGTSLNGQTTVPPAAQSNVVAVAAGWRHALALKTDGSVVGWGNNSYGECNTPLAAQSGVVAISTGLYYSMALKADGSVVAWGGFNGSANQVVPSGARSNVVAILATVQNGAAIKPDGSVVIWDLLASLPIQAPLAEGLPDARFMAITGGAGSFVGVGVPVLPTITRQPFNGLSHVGQTSSLTATAAGFYFGYHWQKNGIDIPGATNPTFVSGPVQGLKTDVYTLVVSNAYGSVTSAPVMLDPPPPLPSGRVVAWGTNTSGQCTVPTAALSNVVAISASTSNTMALKSDGSVLVWGDNTFGQTNVPAAASTGVVAIASGVRSFMALKSDGSVLVWGEGGYGQTNVPPAAKSGVVAIACDPAGDVMEALKLDGSVVTWGLSVAATFPQSGAVAIAAGDFNFFLFLDAYGAVFGSGRNSGYHALEIPAAAQSNVVAIAAGFFNGLALRAEGNVVGWGYGLNGVNRIPAELNSGVTAIAVSPDIHSLAIKADKSLVLWGYDSVSAGGIPAEAQNQVLAIATSDHHCVAIVDLQPTLAINVSGTNVNLSWPTNNSLGYILQAAASLTPSAWKDYTNTLSVQSGSYFVTISPTAGNTFFRLKK
jgi:alpha-tubulin suppressor-like RCC1 family protein